MDKIAMYKEEIYKIAEESRQKPISLGKGALIGASVPVGLGALSGGALASKIFGGKYFLQGAKGGALSGAYGAPVGALIGTGIQAMRQSARKNRLQEEALRRQLDKR